MESDGSPYLTHKMKIMRTKTTRSEGERHTGRGEFESIVAHINKNLTEAVAIQSHSPRQIGSVIGHECEAFGLGLQLKSVGQHSEKVWQIHQLRDEGKMACLDLCAQHREHIVVLRKTEQGCSIPWKTTKCH